MLTAEQIELLLAALQVHVLFESERFIFAKRVEGYSPDLKVSSIQAALSIELEVARKRKR